MNRALGIALLFAWAAVVGCDKPGSAPSVPNAAPVPIVSAPPASATASATAISAPAASAPRASAAAGAPRLTGIWHASEAMPGASPADAYLLWGDGHWQWRASSHRMCDAGPVARMGRWREAEGALMLDEDATITREVSSPGTYAKYRACTGSWGRGGCNPKDGKSADADCTLSGTTDRVAMLGKPKPVRVALGKCAPSFDGKECLTMDGVKHWRWPDELDTFLYPLETVAWDAAAGRWKRSASIP